MTNSMFKALVAGAVSISSVVPQVAGAGAATRRVALPDWSGDWVVLPVETAGPVYTADWIAKRKARASPRKAGDPTATCGVLAGMPRMLGTPGIHEWIITQDAVRHALENDFNSVQRIFTDGRKHASPDDTFPSYTGDNVGRWEGGTLVVDTIGLKDDTWLDDLGNDHSDQLHIVTRVRKLPDGRLEAQARVEDSVAFAKPWIVTRHYRRLPAGSFVRDYACGIVATAEQAATLNK